MLVRFQPREPRRSTSAFNPITPMTNVSHHRRTAKRPRTSTKRTKRLVPKDKQTAGQCASRRNAFSVTEDTARAGDEWFPPTFLRYDSIDIGFTAFCRRGQVFLDGELVFTESIRHALKRHMVNVFWKLKNIFRKRG